MKAPPRFETPMSSFAAMPPPSSEFRDWSHLPDLALSDVLSRLIPCLSSLSAFAATCRPWRRFFLASASTLLPRIPPLLLQPVPDSKSSHLHAFSRLVIPKLITAPLAAFPSTLLSSSRGHLILLVRPRGLLLLIDALNGAERLALPLPSPYFPYQYAALTPTHLLLFVSKHAFVSLPFPTPNPTPEWTHHRLPRAASFVTVVIDFRGRILGVTDRAQLLEFRLDADIPDQAVQMLPTTGLPDNAAFDRWHFGPRLVAVGERLLLLLLKTDPDGGGAMTMQARVRRVSVHALDMAAMRWEEVDSIGEHSLFVDCAGRSAVACAAAAGCGVEANRVYFAQPRWRMTASGLETLYWNASYPPGWEASPGDEGEKLFISQHVWPSANSETLVYPRLFF